MCARYGGRSLRVRHGPVFDCGACPEPGQGAHGGVPPDSGKGRRDCGTHRSPPAAGAPSSRPRSLSSPVDNRGSVPRHGRFRKSFTMCTYKKCARKSSAMCTYKITGLKPSWNEQLQKTGGLPPPFLLLPASLLPWLMAGTKLPPVAPAAACLDE